MSISWASSLWKPRTQMQTPKRMDKLVIKYYFHTTTITENMNWMELAHLLSMFV